MRMLTLLLLAVIISGCALKEKKSEPPLREKFEEYWIRMHSVPEFIEAEKMREAGHQNMRNAYKALHTDEIIYHCDKALQCYSAAADLYFAGKKKHPDFSEYANSELDITYKFMEESIRERPFLTKPPSVEAGNTGELTDQQKAMIQTLQEKIRQYQATQIK